MSGRQGERNPAAVLNEAEVHDIRTLRGLRSVRETARLYGISKSQVSRIQRGQGWSELRLVNEQEAA